MLLLQDIAPSVSPYGYLKVVLIVGHFISFFDKPTVSSSCLFLYFLDVKGSLAMLLELGLQRTEGSPMCCHFHAVCLRLPTFFGHVCVDMTPVTNMYCAVSRSG